MNTKSVCRSGKKIISVLFFLLSAFYGIGQDQFLNAKEISVELLPNEKWWGGLSVDGVRMPYSSDSPFTVNLYGDAKGNQGQPFFVSNMGRYIWSEDPFTFKIEGNKLSAVSEFSNIELGQSGTTMKEAFLYASKKFFPSNGLIPDTLLFVRPQYNTWIELMYDQNQENVLKYAKGIVENHFPTGIIMIDDNWQMDYGNWKFNPEKFSDPKEMCRQLHEMGFKIMLWVCPFISPDSEIYRYLRDRKLLLRNTDHPDEPAMIGWWNGYSALLDLSNPEAMLWFKEQLKSLQEKYGVDGFKLDAGDVEYYANTLSFKNVHMNAHMELYASVGLDFKLNEFRACWKLAGQPLVQRLRDKKSDWADVRKLIPDMLALSMLGYAYGCPDMIGGGDYSSFLNGHEIDRELVVRSAQVHALMPMMQFSVAPWRILDQEHLNAAQKAAFLHVQFKDVILNLAKKSARTGEPIVRPMEYNFPHQGFLGIKDQFMLGDEFLVAPVVNKGQRSRRVVLPKGAWIDDAGTKLKGGQEIVVETPLDKVPYFKKISD
jgi:alpha-glucosidase